jgi:alkyl hydroperoxide reductase subunit AhpF
VSYIKEILVQILIKDDPENICAKCCKTTQVIDRMMEEITEFNDKVEILYIDTNSKENIEKYQNLERPAVIINGKVFSEGHIPIIKKLSRELFKILNES